MIADSSINMEDDGNGRYWSIGQPINAVISMGKVSVVASLLFLADSCAVIDTFG